MSLAPEYKKLTGVAHFMAAATYSAGGLSRAWKEAAFRQEVAAGCGLAAVYGWLGVDLATAVAATILIFSLTPSKYAFTGDPFLLSFSTTSCTLSVSVFTSTVKSFIVKKPLFTLSKLSNDPIVFL